MCGKINPIYRLFTCTVRQKVKEALLPQYDCDNKPEVNNDNGKSVGSVIFICVIVLGSIANFLQYLLHKNKVDVKFRRLNIHRHW